MKGESGDPTSFSRTTLRGKGKGVGVFRFFLPSPPRMLWQEVDRESLLPLTFCLGRNHYWENGSDHKPSNDDGRMMEDIHPFIILDCSIPAKRTNRPIPSVLLGLWRLETLAGHSPESSRVVQG